MPQTPLSKRQRSVDDLTPTQRVSGVGVSELNLGDSSERGSTASSTGGRPTRRALSPKKREVALRQARQFPVRRQHISAMSDPSSLMRELARTGQPRDAWFLDSPTTSEGATEKDDVYMYRRVRHIRDNTLKARRRMAHEAERGMERSCPLASVRTSPRREQISSAGVVCRNVTQCAVYPELREPDPRITDTKSDYALCLDPEQGSRLAGLLRAYRQLGEENRTSHIQFSDEANTPPAVGVETKSGGDGGTRRRRAARRAPRSFVLSIATWRACRAPRLDLCRDFPLSRC
ncbi:hypothetical protein ISF_08019 [Cordyceps fumosorosea ARSEF 2679]|uniref:PD-(D/E)XK nuclease-like domain-containing protein n=1 Tax=Cordyceps fumosorosea (strain ARSEF 2679) TaxID=1081104 RepID=A0A167N3U2_CORFA|nr:hypothetical protein ISF_08019 [Cordyceps fumosorosea ARSEF 2679]OAA55098.1 hypothetical protein ISF_08019 [Cordyceps fumosorosea ARSEF 2679]